MASQLAHPAPLRERPWWPAAKRAASFAFFALVLWLIARQARQIEWSEVLQSARDYPPAVLLTAAGLAAASYALYCSYDLLSRRYSGHSLSNRAVLATTFISYAFNLNFGSLIGGLAFRVRLYSQQGLEAAQISRIFGFTMLTNWVGYVALAGVLCVWQPIAPPEDWHIGRAALRGVGLLLLALPLVYLTLCATSRRRSLRVRGHELHLPSWRMAALQLLLSCCNWMLIGAVVYTLLQQHVDYASTLSVLLVAAVAGVITHVPAGLGVLEAVFLTLLASQAQRHELLAALLVYRAVYYLIPLVIAIAVYIGFEWRLRRGSPPTVRER